MDDKKITRIISEKNRKISTIISNKDESIRLSSIRRDAALFTASRLGSFKQASQKEFIEELEYWLKYFDREVYKSHKQLEKENYKAKRAEEIKDTLSHLDIDYKEPNYS